MALLAIENLQVDTLNQRLLHGVSVSIDAGEIHALVGDSGAGKSTLARTVLGALPQALSVSAGRVIFRDQDLLKLNAKSIRELMGVDIALIPQDPLSALNPCRKIAAQLGDGLRLRKGLGRREARLHAGELLENVLIRDVDRVLQSYPHQLSGGMRQRVLIAAAFSLSPTLIIADEPTTALDVTVQKEVLRALRTLQRERGTAILFVTHDLGVVAKLCDSLSVMYDGSIVEQGHVADVFSAAKNDYTRALLAATPRYDQPAKTLTPVPKSVLDSLAQAQAQERQV